MSTRDLIDSIESGDSIAIQAAFESAMATRIADRFESMRQEVAQNMFKEAAVEVAEEVEDLDETSCKDNELHVQSVKDGEQKGKYRVHAVGKKYSDGIKAGEHLNDTELDDFAEMGGKVKHVK